MRAAKFPSTCKKCGTVVEAGKPVYFQRAPKVICGSFDCFTEQGGKLDSGSSFNEGGPATGTTSPAPYGKSLSDKIAETNKALVNAIDQYKQLPEGVVISPDQVAMFLMSMVKTTLSVR